MAHRDGHLYSENLPGTILSDVIHPGGGNDTVSGGWGNDLIDDGVNHSFWSFVGGQ